jgi:hypothetical protein
VSCCVEITPPFAKVRGRGMRSSRSEMHGNESTLELFITYLKIFLASIQNGLKVLDIPLRKVRLVVGAKVFRN